MYDDAISAVCVLLIREFHDFHGAYSTFEYRSVVSMFVSPRVSRTRTRTRSQIKTRSQSKNHKRVCQSRACSDQNVEVLSDQDKCDFKHTDNPQETPNSATNDVAVEAELRPVYNDPTSEAFRTQKADFFDHTSVCADCTCVVDGVTCDDDNGEWRPYRNWTEFALHS